MKESRRIEITPLRGRVFSLCWVGDELVDFGGGIICYNLDGDNRYRYGGFGASFDRCVCHQKSGYAVTYESLGTKGIVLKDDQIVREVNRSYYHARTYEYPLAIFEWIDGRIVIAHCPDEYCRLEIEEIDTGKRLTERETKSPDFFHSRLAVSPDRRHLLSAGWVWQPWDCAYIYDLHAVGENPELLDRSELGVSGIEAEETSSAAFLSSKKLLYSGPNTDDPQAKYLLGIHDLATSKSDFEVEIDHPAGTLMPVGDYVVTFFGHPRLREISTGKIITEWPDINSGLQNSSVLHHLEQPMPVLALDPERKRFAIGAGKKITVVELA